jgi:regulatory protein
VAPSPEPDADPDRHTAAARSVRVARLDAVAEGPDGGPEAPRVARFDGLDERVGTETRVAGLDGLDQQAGASNRVAALRGDLGRPRGARSRRQVEPRLPGDQTSDALVDATPDTRRPADPADADVTSPGAHRPAGSATGGAGPATPRAADPVPTDDAVPPDAPLPRGRRGDRGRRRGPDAPAPEQPDAAADPVAVAREICLRLLTDRARTRQELGQAMAGKGVPDDAAAAVLDRFDEVGLIDDAAFAGQWVRSRHTYRGLGRRAIAVELRRKGVADDVAGEALAEVDAASEERRARELVDRKLRSLTVATAEQRGSAGRRLVGMLARKGYGAGTAYRVVREALAARGAEVDELGAADALDE